jgi:thiamine pyrophosphate-dependent acetolactate synthase large subunit-like protein
VFGPGAFQEIDLASAFRAVSRFSQTVLHGSRHAELMTLALKHAVVQRDVAHLIFPDEVQVIPADENAQASSPQGRLAADDISPLEAGIRQALQKIAASSRPVTIVGYGARNAMQDVMALAERLHAPVLSTFKAKGQSADSHALPRGYWGEAVHRSPVGV